MKALVWPVATYRNNEETRLDTFEMKGLRKIPRISWTAQTDRQPENIMSLSIGRAET